MSWMFSVQLFKTLPIIATSAPRGDAVIQRRDSSQFSTITANYCNFRDSLG